jgi:UDP:flavonoid glycosyltransferase YjiC (YdhE family)
MIILMPHCAFLSETSRMLEIWRALAARGVEARIATHGGPFTRIYEEAGVPFDFLSPRIDPETCARFVARIPGMTKSRRPVFEPDELRTLVAGEVEYLRQRGAKAVVTGFNLSALLSSRVAGIPLITEHAGSFVPPVFERGLIPAPLRSPIPFAELLPGRVRRFLANAGATRVKFYCATLNTVARELDVEPVPSLAALLLGDLTLVTDVPELTGVSKSDLESWSPIDPRPYRKGAKLRYVGPLYARLEVPVPAHVDAFLARPGPTVFVSISSSTPERIREIVAAVAKSGAKVLVAGTIHALDDLGSDRICVGGVLPNHLIFPRVDLGVIAGGQGTVQTALVGGAPFIGIPLQPEQDWNVACAERSGAAMRMSMKDAASLKMTRAVERLLADPDARAAAGQLGAALSAIDGPSECARAIIEYLSLAPSTNEARAAAEA